MINEKEQLKEFGIWFSKLRETSGYSSQRQLAISSNVSPTTISRIEAGSQKAEPDTLAKLAPFLKVSFEDLMSAAGYPITATGKIEPKMPKDLKKILEQQEIMFSGTPLDEEDRQEILDIIQYHLYKRAKELNKRKPKGEKL